MTREELEKVRAWANDKIATGEQPPWAWYQYMKLRETMDAILAGMAATRTVGSPLSEPHPETGLRLVASNNPQDIAQHHAAGVSDHVWDVGNIVDVLETWERREQVRRVMASEGWHT